MKISVRDTGIGISKEHINKLFVNFGKIKNKLSLNENGCGLGLSICKRISERMGGMITVDSEPSKGSTFIFYFEAYAVKESS